MELFPVVMMKILIMVVEVEEFLSMELDLIMMFRMEKVMVEVEDVDTVGVMVIALANKVLSC